MLLHFYYSFYFVVEQFLFSIISWRSGYSDIPFTRIEPVYFLFVFHIIIYLLSFIFFSMWIEINEPSVEIERETHVVEVPPRFSCVSSPKTT